MKNYQEGTNTFENTTINKKSHLPYSKWDFFIVSKKSKKKILLIYFLFRNQPQIELIQYQLMGVSINRKLQKVVQSLHQHQF